MNINKKIISIIVLSFLLISIIFSYDSVSSLKKNQGDNIALFKKEFIELGRELFEKNSSIFFSAIDGVDVLSKNNKPVSEYIESTYKSEGDGIIVLDMTSLEMIYGSENQSISALYDKKMVKGFVEEYILNQKRSFDVDNFIKFEKDTTNSVVPIKVHFRVYEKSGVIVGFGQIFLTGKIRVEFIERQNQVMFTSQLYSSIVLTIITLILITIFMTYSMRMIVVNPLTNIILVVKVITDGDLSKRVEVKSKDEIGQLGNAFNNMTEKLQSLYNDMDKKIVEKTAELTENIKDLDRQNLAISNILKEIKEPKQDNK